MNPLPATHITPDHPVGGKAAALARLARAGFRVPDFFVILPGADDADLLEAYDRHFAPGERIACRSSARGEDSAEHSFAGQYDSFLEVGREELLEKAAAVRASGSSEHAAAYGATRGAAVMEPAVIVQRMVAAEFAGVAFSADPVTGRRDIAVVAAVRGLGDALVSGRSDGETLDVDADGGVLASHGDATVGLTEADAARVAALARECAAHFGRPQDIEWAIDGAGELFLLQSRPITTLPAADAPRILWDNSNIAESYSGVTTPMTYSFARRAYENVYREFCRLLWVPQARIEAGEPVFHAMIGLVQGRVYYNLCSWYRVLAMLPGFRLNRAFMEQMMGVREPMPDALVAEIEREASVGPLRDTWHLARTLAGLVVRAVMLPPTIRAFHARLDAALAAVPAADFDTLAPHELIDHYQQLEASLLRRWDAPLINDFFAMIACGVLRKWSARWLGDESLANHGLRDIGEIISLEPARRIQAMAAKSARGESISTDLAAYLDRFGDRCVEELKLESPTLADDPAPLHRAIEAMAARIRENPVPPANPPHDTTLDAAIARLPWHRRKLYLWMLEKARHRVRDRENLRFERTRLFGRVRRILRGLGAHLTKMHHLRDADDIFYCELGEVLGFFDGTASAPVCQQTLDSRRVTFASWRAAPPPPDRCETNGPPALESSIIARAATAEAQGTDLGGIGACAGIVRGPVRIVIDPRGVELARGEILVAQQTDPGWVVLFPAAAGLLVERGSLLSHSAIVAREMNIPAIVSIPGVTSRLTNGEWVEMNGATGAIRRIDLPC